MTDTHFDAIVVGAGHNGLVTAAYLAKAGQRVLVLERRDTVGGVAVTEEFAPGFRVDSCMQGTGWIHPAAWSELELGRRGVELIHTDSTVFAPLPDGDSLLLWRTMQKSAEEINRFSPADAANWWTFSDRMARLASFLEALYSITPPDIADVGLSDILSMARLGPHVRRLGTEDTIELLRVLPMSVAELLDDWFETDLLKGTIGAGGISHIAQGPRAAGTAYLLLHHQLGRQRGALRGPTLVRGGIGRLTAALADAAQQYGAEIRTGAAVEDIKTVHGRVGGVRLKNGQELRADRVISNADPRHTVLDLVGPMHFEPTFVRKIKNIKFRGIRAYVHLALERLPAFASRREGDTHLRGRISLSPSLDYLERASDDAKYGRVSEKPYLSIVIPSLSDDSLAPAGKHVMSIAVQYAPYHRNDGDWDDARRDALGDHVLDTLAEYAPDIRECISHRQVLTPHDLEDIYGVPEGHLYHGELTLDQFFFMRPVAGWAQYRTPIHGLYVCGASTHPGGGVIGAPGYNAAREITSHLKKR